MIFKLFLIGFIFILIEPFFWWILIQILLGFISIL